MRIINQRCRDFGCTAKLWGTNEAERVVIQHGENPEHVLLLTLRHKDWSGKVEAWIARIHRARRAASTEQPHA